MDKNKVWRDYLENILVAVFLALLVRTYVLTGYRIPTGSMMPTLQPGDFIFSFRLPYGIKVPLLPVKLPGRGPERGEVVVFSYANKPRVSYVKRVVGLPGDRVELKQGILSINGVENLQEAITTSKANEMTGAQFFLEHAPEGSRQVLRMQDGASKDFGPFVVPPNEVFLLGDNRDTSDDSRYWGSVPIERVEGRVLVVWLSLDWTPTAQSGLAANSGLNFGSRLPSVRWSRIFTFL